MMPSPPIRNRSHTCYSGLRSHGSTPARAGPQNWPETAPLNGSRNTLFTRSRPRAHPTFEPNRLARPLRSNLPAPHPEAKSP